MGRLAEVDETVSEAERLPGVEGPDLRLALQAARRDLAVFSSVDKAVVKLGRSIAAMSDILRAVSKGVGAVE